MCQYFLASRDLSDCVIFANFSYCTSAMRIRSTEFQQPYCAVFSLRRRNNLTYAGAVNKEGQFFSSGHLISSLYDTFLRTHEWLTHISTIFGPESTRMITEFYTNDVQEKTVPGSVFQYQIVRGFCPRFCLRKSHYDPEFSVHFNVLKSSILEFCCHENNDSPV